MTPTPTSAAVEKIEELLKTATHGPWEVQAGTYTYGPDMSRWEIREVDAELLMALRNSIESILEERKRHVEALKGIVAMAPFNNCSCSEDCSCGEDVMRHIAKTALGSGE